MGIEQFDDLFCRREALATGLNSFALTRLVRSGAVARVARGIYRVGPSPGFDPRAISRSMKASISHDSAAAWLGADLVTPIDRLHLTAPRTRGRLVDCAEGVRLHRADVAPGDLRVVRGAVVTSPTRTLVDIARSLPMTEAVAIGDSLVRRGGLLPESARSAAVALPRGPGRPAAIAVANGLDGRAESVFESISRVTLVTAGLPAPEPQFNIYAERGDWIARVDFAWPQARLVLECDGYEFHHGADAFRHDRRRWSALTCAGWRVLVVTWRDVVDQPQYLVDLVGDALSG